MAEPSSAHTSPSAIASSAPAIQPTIAWGPPIVATMIGIVMNGPIPHIWVMLTAVAGNSPIARRKPDSGVCSSSSGFSV